MMLSIRSQDKLVLMPFNGCEIEKRYKDGNHNGYKIIMGSFHTQSIYELGVYETLERALEVLDEIEESLHKQDFHYSKGVDYPTRHWNDIKIDIVYQMPKE